ncbi:MAG: 50S ribosomal protein L6 [Salinibacterium sp.]|nr:50S ribosomal protein L6 [Salinibacterium sp.]
MSRIGKKSVAVPKGVKLSVSSGVVTVEGPKGTLRYEHRPEVTVTWDENEKSVTFGIDEKDVDNRKVRAYWGLTRALVQNMVVGVSQGYERKLEVVGVGWNASMAGPKLKLQVGYANPVEFAVPQGLTVTAEKQNVSISGPDKQLVGQFAAQVRACRPPEPYNGKGVKYADEVVRRKEGKKAGG